MSKGPIVASDCPTVVKEGTLHFTEINRDFSHSLNFQTKKTRVKTTTKQHLLHVVTTPKWINPTQILNRLKTSLITSPNPTSSNILQNSCFYLKIPHHINLPEHPQNGLQQSNIMVPNILDVCQHSVSGLDTRCDFCASYSESNYTKMILPLMICHLAENGHVIK